MMLKEKDILFLVQGFLDLNRLVYVLLLLSTPLHFLHLELLVHLLCSLATPEQRDRTEERRPKMHVTTYVDHSGVQRSFNST